MKDDDKAILPQDIIIEILKRLPVKSLIRFQSVCKLWKNLIQTPAFITNHLHHSAHNNPSLILINSWYPPNCPHVFLLDSKMEIVEVHKTPLSNSSRGDVKLVGSCNGLLCLELDYHDDASFRFILLWNPASREVRQVTSINNYWGIHSLGFGFSPVVHDYKIVRIWEIHQAVEVYSLSQNSWKQLEFGVKERVRHIFQPAVIVNGTMFWLGMGNNEDGYIVLSFDIATEVFSLIPIPSSISISISKLKLIVYEKKLALFHGPYKVGNMDSSSFFLDLWVMDQESSWGGWTKKCRIGPTSNWLHPLCIWRNEIVCHDAVKMKYGVSPISRQIFHGGLSDGSGSESEVTCEFLSLLNLTSNELKSHSFV